MRCRWFPIWGIGKETVIPVDGSVSLVDHPSIWPYMIIKRCEGNMFAELGDPIPSKLIEKIDEYIPSDLAKLLSINENLSSGACKPCYWIHTDIMDDNIYMESSSACSTSSGNTEDAAQVDNGLLSDHGVKSWSPSHILDFSDLSMGDPIFDLIPIYLEVFTGDSYLLKQFLESYKLPFACNILKCKSTEGGQKFG